MRSQVHSRKFSLALMFVVLTALTAVRASPVDDEAFDVVILQGRVMDPESKLDAVRNIGIQAGKIAAISTEPLTGKRVVEAEGLVVAPGFIDLHQHGQEADNYRFKA